MQIVTIGETLIPAEQIAFVESFDPASYPGSKSDKAFKGRIVLLNATPSSRKQRRRSLPKRVVCACSPSTILPSTRL